METEEEGAQEAEPAAADPEGTANPGFSPGSSQC